MLTMTQIKKPYYKVQAKKKNKNRGIGSKELNIPTHIGKSSNGKPKKIHGETTTLNNVHTVEIEIRHGAIWCNVKT